MNNNRKNRTRRQKTRGGMILASPSLHDIKPLSSRDMIITSPLHDIKPLSMESHVFDMHDNLKSPPKFKVTQRNPTSKKRKHKKKHNTTKKLPVKKKQTSSQKIRALKRELAQLEADLENDNKRKRKQKRRTYRKIRRKGGGAQIARGPSQIAPGMSGSLKQVVKFGRDTGKAISKALKKKAKSSLKKAASKLGFTNVEEQQIQRDIDTTYPTVDPTLPPQVEDVSLIDIQLESLDDEDTQLLPSDNTTEGTYSSTEETEGSDLETDNATGVGFNYDKPKTPTHSAPPQTDTSLLSTPSPPRPVAPQETQLPSDESDTDAASVTSSETDISRLPSLVPPEKSTITETHGVDDESTFGQTTTTDESGNKTPPYKPTPPPHDPTFPPPYKPTFVERPRSISAEQAHIDRLDLARQSSGESGPNKVTGNPYEKTPRKAGYTTQTKPDKKTDYPAGEFVTDPFSTPPREKYPNP